MTGQREWEPNLVFAWVTGVVVTLCIAWMTVAVTINLTIANPWLNCEQLGLLTGALSGGGVGFSVFRISRMMAGKEGSK